MSKRRLVIEEGGILLGRNEVNPNKVAPIAPPPPVPASCQGR